MQYTHDVLFLKKIFTGELDRLQKFWLAGACDLKKEKGISNKTLGILNFTSAFILLGSGILLGLVLLIVEHLYFKFGRKRLKKIDRCGCCALVSLVSAVGVAFVAILFLFVIIKWNGNKCSAHINSDNTLQAVYTQKFIIYYIDFLPNIEDKKLASQPNFGA